MQGNISGAIQTPMQGGTMSGLVQTPMQGGTMSGLMPGAMMNSGMGMQGGFSSTAPPTGYEVARPSSSSMGRRLMFIFAGATIGVVVLVLLLWPSGQDPSRGAVHPSGTTEPKQKTTTPPPGKAGPAHLLVRGLPESRVMLDFKDIGSIPPSGEFAYDAESPGTAEWSVHLKVVKDAHGEFTTRVILKAGDSFQLQAEQPSQAPAPELLKPPTPKSQPNPKRHPSPPSKPAAPATKPTPKELKSFGR
jgi:hypothetical protein